MRAFLRESELESIVHARASALVAAAVELALENAEKAQAERSQFREEQHQWQVTRLTARAEDAESVAARFKRGYKSALAKVAKLEERNAKLDEQLKKAGITQEVDDKGRPKQTPAQEIMDELDGLVPGLDDLSREKVRAYVDRELRKRGNEEKDEILQEVITGGYSDE